MESYLAVYGAIVATVLGYIQIAQYFNDNKFLKITNFQHFHSDYSRNYSFYLNNTSDYPVHIKDCIVENSEVYEGVVGFFVEQPGVFEELNDKVFLLGAGELLKISFSHDRFEEVFGPYKKLPKIRIKIRHSRSNKALVKTFAPPYYNKVGILLRFRIFLNKKFY